MPVCSTPLFVRSQRTQLRARVARSKDSASMCLLPERRPHPVPQAAPVVALLIHLRLWL